MNIGRVLHVRLLKGIFDLHEVKVAALRVRDLLIVRVVLEPLVHVIEGILLSKLVREADA